MKHKIVISEITEVEAPETEYKDTGETDEKGEKKYAYVETGKMTIDITEKAIYEQELEDLDIRDLAVYINRVR